MKKFYMLMGAALTAASALAANGQPTQNVVIPQMKQVSLENVKEQPNERAVLNSISNATRAGETGEELKVNSPVKNLMFFGMNSKGSFYNASIGLTPAWGTLSWTAIAEGATGYKWNWNNAYTETNPGYMEYNIEGANLNWTIQPGNIMRGMTVSATKGDATIVGAPMSSWYYQGASPKYYSTNYAEATLTMYPRADYLEDGQYCGTSVGYMSIDKTPASVQNYDSNGVFKDWSTRIPKYYTGSTAEDITDVKIDGFAYEIPAMSSPYILGGMNLWANVTASEATTLKGSIYEVVNGKVGNVVLAKFSANVAAGSSDNLEFDVVPVDEDGDEVEEDFIIDNKTIFIWIEGLSTNAAIQKFIPVYGNGTIWPTEDSQNSPYYRNSYVSMALKYKGQDDILLATCPVNYYTDNTKVELFMCTNYWWNFDINFPFVKNAETEGREITAEIPVAGGEAKVGVESCWNLGYCVQNELITGKIEGDWITGVTVGASEDGVQPITVKGSALPAGTQGRTATINFTGMAADFSINVTQGTPEAGVGEIVVDSEAATVYYDLQGRKVVGTPDKGIYIVKQGNKAKKVVL